MSSSSDTECSETFQEVLNARILEHLQPLKTTGSFATSKTCKEFVPPGISIAGLGSIPLPLSEEDASRLIGTSQKAPFGKGSQTLVDEKVRRTWEINGSQVSFQNPDWPEFFENIVAAASKNLGVPARPETITAELYKLLLYEKGAFFKPHKDTEKTPGMFATLVICLPSQHLGGTVCLQHGQKEYRFDTDKSSAFGLTYLSWYTDVTHSVELVQSGYRLVLSYNMICNPEGPSPSAMKLRKRLDDFVEILSDWQSEKSPAYVCYALDHQYTHASLALKTLKGNDYVRVRHVSDACVESGHFCALLATMQNGVTFPADEHHESDVKSEFSLSRIVDVSGSVVQDSLLIEEDHIVQRDLYTDRKPDEQQGGEYLGNQNAEIDRFYNDTVLIIVPKSSANRFLLGTSYNLQRLDQFLTRLLENLQDPFFHLLINQTCEMQLKYSYSNPSIKSGVMGLIAVAAVALSDRKMFKRALERSEDGFNDQAYYSLGTKHNPKNIIIPKNVLATAFSSKQLYKIWRRFRKYIDGVSLKNCVDEVSHTEAWIKDQMSKTLGTFQEIVPSDAAALVDMFEIYGIPFFESSIKPTIIRFSHNIAFANAVVVETLSSHKMLADDATRFITIVLDVGSSHFDLNYFSSAGKNRNEFPHSSWPQCSFESEKATNDAKLIVRFYKELVKSGAKPKGDRFLERLQSQFKTLKKPYLDQLIIPLLNCFCTVLDMASPVTVEFCKNLLDIYSLHTVGSEPAKPPDWSRPEVSCYRKDCSDCEFLNKFLQNPRRKKNKFVASKNRFHLQYQAEHCKVSEISDTSDLPSIMIEKTFEGYKMEKEKWTEKAKKAQQQIESLPVNLQACLGDNWVEIMNLESLRVKESIKQANCSIGKGGHQLHKRDEKRKCKEEHAPRRSKRFLK